MTNIGISMVYRFNWDFFDVFSKIRKKYIKYFVNISYNVLMSNSTSFKKNPQNPISITKATKTNYNSNPYSVMTSILVY